MGKGEKCWLPAFSPFPAMFSKGFFFSVFKNLGLFDKELALYHIIPTFNDPEIESFWKQCGKRRKMLVTSIFSFSHYVFYPPLTHSNTMTPLTPLGNKPFENTGKRRNCSKRAISPFPTVFSTHLDNFLLFSSNLTLSSANSFSLKESKICRLVMGLTHYQTTNFGLFQTERVCR